MSEATSKDTRRSRMVDYLRNRRDPVPVSELARSLDVTVRTVLRDADALRADGLILSGTRGRGGGLKLERNISAVLTDRVPDTASDLPDALRSDAPRLIFVGRSGELKALRAVHGEVLEGRGSVVVLAGEPGIGKTMLAKRSTDEFSQQGDLVLWGRCLESEGALPYWPWVQMIRTYAMSRSPEQLVDDFGEGAADVGEIVPEIFERIPDLDKPGSVITPESARFRLFDSLGIFFQNVSRHRPLVLVLEDLHRADRPSLLLLEFVSQLLGTSKILVLGTYRDVELSRRHPLTRSLAELNRQPGFLRLSLKGLTEDETGELLEHASGRPPDRALVSSLYRQTEGNPLFVSEMTLLLLQGAENGHELKLTDRAENLRIPEGIREALGQRLDRLSSESNEMLRAASVLGREFSLPELRHLLAGLPGNSGDGKSFHVEMLNMFDEAMNGHLLKNASGDLNRFQFTHSLIRDTLYQELTTIERVQLHQLAGEAVENLYVSELADHLPQLAHHFLEAARGGHSSKAVRYAGMAGLHAVEMVANEEAVRYFDMALEGLALNDQIDERRRCELMISKGRSQQASGELIDARSTLIAAFDIANRCGYSDLCADAAIAFEIAGWHPGMNGLPAVKLLRTALEGLPEDDSEQRALTLAALGRALNYSGLHDVALDIGTSAIDMARRLGDKRTLATTIWNRLATRSDPQDIHARVDLGFEAVQICEELGGVDLIVNAEAWLMNDLTELGDTRWTDEVYKTWRSRVIKLRDPMWVYNLSTKDIGLACAEGRFEEAEEIARRALQHGRRLGGLDADGLHGAMMFCIRREQGRLAEVKPALELFLKYRPTEVWQPGLALLYAELDLREQAKTDFESIARNNFAAVNRDALFTCALAYLTDVCAYLEDAERAAVLYEDLLEYEGRNISQGVANMYIGPAARYLGSLATTMSRWNEAEKHFDDALQMASNMNAPTQVAHCKYLYGKMLWKRQGPGDRQRSRSLLTDALNLARGMGMRTLIARASGALMMRDAEKPGFAYFPAGLSTREAEVLKLLALGKSNREIGEELFISLNTVANHVKTILQKTGSANRTEAAAFAVRNRITES